MAKETVTPRQERFVREYLVDRNGTAAARRAGYTGTVQALAVSASRLLKLPKIAVRLEAGEARLADRTEVSAERVIRELARVAFSDISLAFGPDGRLLNIHEMPPEARAALSGVETEELFEGKGEERVQVGVSRKVKQWDKVKALELLAKHLRLLTEKLELDGPGGQPLSIRIDLGAGK